MKFSDFKHIFLDFFDLEKTFLEFEQKISD